jgi:hypothetical protein
VERVNFSPAEYVSAESDRGAPCLTVYFQRRYSSLRVSESPSWSVFASVPSSAFGYGRFAGYGRYWFGVWCSSSLRSRADWYS